MLGQEDCIRSVFRMENGVAQSAVVAAIVGVFTWVVPTEADAWGYRPAYCSNTAKLQFGACQNEIRDDFLTGQAICLNFSDPEDREECGDKTREDLSDGKELCSAQYRARKNLCKKIGEARYDPDFDPELFDDPKNPTNPNPYYPLAVGSIWMYESDGETTRIEVLDKTKSIEGVTCIVVNDFVQADDGTSEDTNDWFGVRKDGTVEYCGEEVKDFETFEGDDPMDPELVSIEGSFKVGQGDYDGDKKGCIMLANREVGKTYRQEWSASNAEDAATIVSTTYPMDSDPDLDECECVPEEVVQKYCVNNDCVVTREFNPKEPFVLEFKLYARNIGLFLEVNPDPEEGGINELVGCNVDPECPPLP